MSQKFWNNALIATISLAVIYYIFIPFPILLKNIERNSHLSGYAFGAVIGSIAPTGLIVLFVWYMKRRSAKKEQGNS